MVFGIDSKECMKSDMVCIDERYVLKEKLGSGFYGEKIMLKPQ